MDLLTVIEILIPTLSNKAERWIYLGIALALLAAIVLWILLL